MRLIHISLFLLCFTQTMSAIAASLTVYAAASTVSAMKPIEKLWSETGKRNLRVVYGSSGALARQISAGAPAHVYFSANRIWVDYLVDEKLARPESRKTVMENRLALIAPASAKGISIASLARDVPRLLKDGGRLAMGDPRHVPAGHYAKEALTSLGIWSAVAATTARTRNVRLALALVQRGEVPLSIVYRTDALGDPLVRILDILPGDLHSPVEYQVVGTATRHPDSDAFLAFLTSDDALALYRAAGFVVPE